MKKLLSKIEYNQLPSDEKEWYRSEYSTYTVKKVRHYEDCDLGHTHFMGWIEQKKPIGEPHYIKLTPKEYNSVGRQLQRYYSKEMVRMAQAPLIMGRSSKDDKRKIITFSRYSDL